MSRYPSAGMLIALLLVAGCTGEPGDPAGRSTAAPSAARASSPETSSSSPTEAPPPVSAQAREIWADYVKRFVKATDRAYGPRHDASVLAGIAAGSAWVAANFKAERYRRTGETDKRITFTVKPLACYEPEDLSNAIELACAVRMRFQDTDSRDEGIRFTVLRRTSITKPWLLHTMVDYDGSHAPLLAPEPAPPTAAERKEVLALARRVMRYYDGEIDKADPGFLAGPHGSRAAGWSPGLVLESRTTSLYAGPGGSASDAVVVRRTADGIIGIVSALSRMVVDGMGSRALPRPEYLVYGSGTRETVWGAVPFVVRLPETGQPILMAAQSSWALP